ncbi:MAG: hypothetical protein JWR38_3956 [Mucilaginibacter sp.]|nr:hypothetical protein [Mucilaginibacter sp.]
MRNDVAIPDMQSDSVIRDCHSADWRIAMTSWKEKALFPAKP